VLGGRPEAGGDQERADLVAVQGGRVRLVVHPGPADVRGGRVVADWPGLAPSALLENRDLLPTLDLRSVFKGVLDEHMHVDAKSLGTRVFPDSAGAPALRGLMRA